MLTHLLGLFHSMAGLMAAAVCADHFESVTIIEPEASANEAAGTEFLSKIETRTDAHGLRVPLPPRKRIVQWYANHGECYLLALMPCLPPLMRTITAID